MMFTIRSHSPQQATGNALTAGFKAFILIIGTDSSAIGFIDLNSQEQLVQKSRHEIARFNG